MYEPIFFTSDMHFGERNKCSKTRCRVFETYEHFVRSYVQWYNEIVPCDGIVYFLGDVFTVERDYSKLMNLLNGKKILIAGNNDKLQFVPEGIEVRGTTYFPEHHAILSHFPIHPDMFATKNWLKRNIHGHCHSAWDTPDKRYFDVSCDGTQYRPVSIAEINRFMNFD